MFYTDLVVGNLLSVLEGKGEGVREFKGTFEAIFITNGKVGLFSPLFLRDLTKIFHRTEWRSGLRR